MLVDPFWPVFLFQVLEPFADYVEVLEVLAALERSLPRAGTGSPFCLVLVLRLPVFVQAGKQLFYKVACGLCVAVPLQDRCQLA